MRKILNFIVLFAFIFQQVAWANPLPWKPDFESASVLPCHVDGLGRRWVLLSKKTYKDTDYDAPSWGDFGGKVEAKDRENATLAAARGRHVGAVALAAARELREETAGQIITTAVQKITTDEEKQLADELLATELLAGSSHQIDMAKSPFGDKGVRRHTIFFKMMDTMFMPAVEKDADQGPTREGSREVSQYQWVLASNLLAMEVPGIFGQVLGLYTLEALRVESLSAAVKKEHFSVPFFVLLQQSEVRKTLLQKPQDSFSAPIFSSSAASASVAVSPEPVLFNTHTFSQIVFTKQGFQDWRLVHGGVLSAHFLVHEADPEIDDSMIDDEGDVTARVELFAKRIAKSNVEQRQRQLAQILAFDSEAIQESTSDDEESDVAVSSALASASPASAPVVSTLPVQIRLFHRPAKAENIHPLVGSPNAWRVESTDVNVQELMKQYTLRSIMLQELRSGALALKAPQVRLEKPHLKILPLEEGKVLYVQKYSREITVLKAAETPTVVPVTFPFGTLPTMTDAQLLHLLGAPGDLTDTAAVLEAYKAKVTSMRSYATVDTITHPSFVASVAAVLEEERAHPEMFTAHHGCTAEVHFLNTVYAALGKALGLPDRPVNWRLFDRAARRYGNISSAFTDTAQSAIQDSGFVNPFEVLLSANAALTGNPEHDGCRTLTYWKSSYSEVSLDLKHVLRDVLTGIGLSADSAADLADPLYAFYERLYFVDDPEPPIVVAGSCLASGEDSDTAPIVSARRRVGVLRQLFVAPESVERELAISGWFFNHPLSFADRQLPDGTVVSIYHDLEESDNAWMKELPHVLRFMTHIRAGHSVAMERNIAVYHEQVPNGLRPFNLHDFEVRVFAGQDPTLVKTHFYPQSPADATREDDVKRLTLDAIGDQLHGTELPVRSFHDFNIAHRHLQEIIKNQLDIKVAPAPVSLEQFKAAVPQGDREAMEVYLSDPRTHNTQFEAVDIISGKTRFFTVTDYMAMTAIRHRMALKTIIAGGKKYNLLSGSNIHSTDTPFALSGLLCFGGLNDLEKLSWNGEISTPFCIALRKEVSDVSLPDAAAVAKEKRFSGEFYKLTIQQLMGVPKTGDTFKFLKNIATRTDYSKLPPAFWSNLIATGNIGTFLSSGLLDNVNTARWSAVVAGFTAAGVTEDSIYHERDALLKIFRSTKIQLSQTVPHTTTGISRIAAQDILRKLVDLHGKAAILDQLKAFGADFGFSLVTEDKDDHEQVPHRAYQIYEIFNSVDLVDNTWKEFLNQLIAVPVTGKEDEQADDIVSIMRNGYTNFEPRSVCWMLRGISVPKVHECLGNPLLSDVILEGFKYLDHIEENTKFSPAEKRELHRHLYYLAHQKGKLATIKTVPAEVAEWFSALDEGERLAMLKSPSFNFKMADLVGLPGAYTGEAAISALRAELFPTSASAIDFMLKSVDVLNTRSLEWFKDLLQPYIQPAFEAALAEPERMTAPAVALFATAGMQVPGDYPPGSLDTLTRKLCAESVLLLSPVQIVNAFGSYGTWKFRYSSDGKGYIRDLLAERLERVKDEVKAGFTTDEVAKADLRKMLVPGESEYMLDCVRTFLTFLVTD